MDEQITEMWLERLFERLKSDKPDSFRKECCALRLTVIALMRDNNIMRMLGGGGIAVVSPKNVAERLDWVGDNVGSPLHREAANIIRDLLQENARLADLVADVQSRRDESPIIAQEGK